MWFRRRERRKRIMQDRLLILLRKAVSFFRCTDLPLWPGSVCLAGAGIVLVAAGAGIMGRNAALCTGVILFFVPAVWYGLWAFRFLAGNPHRQAGLPAGAGPGAGAAGITGHVVAALPEPLFIIDAAGVIEHANHAAGELVGIKLPAGRHFASVLRVPDVHEALESVASSASPAVVEFSIKGSVDRWCRAHIARVDAGEGKGAASAGRILVFIRDLTGEYRLEKMRSDFIASASHELRTPLSSVTGFIETLRGPAKDDPEVREKFLSIMQSEAERMQRLVSDLMSLSDIELKEHVPHRDLVDIGKVVSGVLESMEPLFIQDGTVTGTVLETEKSVTVRGSRDEIFQIMQNLLHNAVKYGGEPAKIDLHVGRGIAPALEGSLCGRAGDAPEQVAARLGITTDRLVHIRVRDYGPGVDRSVLPRLTERFYRVSIERSRQTGGTGLGLAIVKHIMNRHKGGFQMESIPGKGTAFNCYFQVADVRDGKNLRATERSRPEAERKLS